MSKKQINTAAIASELRQGSVFFQQPEPQDHPLSIAQPSAHEETAEQVNTRTPAQANTRTGERPHTRTGEQVNRRAQERTISRESYNVFKDQHQALIRLEAESRLSGKVTNKSEMVREALEDYLNKKGRRTANG